jgi:uncharacterized surface anchored protein
VNDAIYGSIRIVKTTEDKTTPLSGARLALYKKGETTVIAEGVSGADGIVTFDNIPYGDYVIRETQAPEGYDLSSEEITVTVKENGVTVEAGNFINMPTTESPKTGDDIMLYFVLAFGCMTGIAVVYVINKRIKKIN